MTTATKSETDPAAAIATVREQLEAARKERARLGEEARADQSKVQAAEAALNHLAHTAPDQFEAGHPAAKSEAAKAKRIIEEASTSRWPAILEGADQRIRDLEKDVANLIRDAAPQLARAEYEAGQEEVGELRGYLAGAREVIGRIRSYEPALLSITTASGGAIDGRSIQIDPRLEELERVLDSLEDLQAARVPVLSPFEDEEPQVVRTADGGWVRATVAGDTELGEQPERIERPS